MTLTPFRMNTYKKHRGEGGGLVFPAKNLRKLVESSSESETRHSSLPRLIPSFPTSLLPYHLSSCHNSEVLYDPPTKLSRVLPARGSGDFRADCASPRAWAVVPAPGPAPLRVRHHGRRQRYGRRPREAQSRGARRGGPGPFWNARASYTRGNLWRQQQRRLRLDSRSSRESIHTANHRSGRLAGGG